MSDFTSGFWNWYIVLITVLGIAGCAPGITGSSERC